MWVRGVVGVLFCLIGGVWIAQGTGALGGSMMSGHGQYAVLGAIVVLVGLAMLWWAWRIRGRRRDG
ncbi:hypothetical protein GCM10023194_62720 [Planotetraspora phitsanulokensis]|uniref:Uncharacterized protein n=1 Tax=Planotetraspora phitsanulokensis TaxID=575192 RepID=A0A8J3XDN7_9ACTN|nr:hypothetical protein [Planotetraspora phitsanulokensis]GII37507.1 hypothetical protein Pph01_25100 [Planotetraspora phitsanulokensis]